MERWVQLHGKKASKRSALDDAYVFIGEALQGQKKPKKAIHAFQKVYKMGASKADMWTKAVFRMGQCFETLGDKAGARAFYKMASAKGSGHFAKKSAQRIKRLR
jgi:TolA-binding protein